MTFCNTEEGFCRARWLAATLFPVLESAYGNPKQRCEGSLRQPRYQTGMSDFRYLGTMDASTNAGFHLTHRRQQFGAKVNFRLTADGLLFRFRHSRSPL